MRYATIGLTIQLSLTACAAAPSEPQAITCPDVVEYSCEVQQAAAVELERGQTPVLFEFIKDYGVMRNQSRICAGRPLPRSSCNH